MLDGDLPVAVDETRVMLDGDLPVAVDETEIAGTEVLMTMLPRSGAALEYAADEMKR